MPLAIWNENAVSALASARHQAIFGVFVHASPAVILSGHASPIENMPAAFEWLSRLDPIRCMLVIARGVFLRGIRATVAAQQVWPVALIAAAMLGAAASAVWRAVGGAGSPLAGSGSQFDADQRPSRPGVSRSRHHRDGRPMRATDGMSQHIVSIAGNATLRASTRLVLAIAGALWALFVLRSGGPGFEIIAALVALLLIAAVLPAVALLRQRRRRNQAETGANEPGAPGACLRLEACRPEPDCGTLPDALRAPYPDPRPAARVR